ncbi:MAG TPA: Fe2+-dependent dioxygenase [Kiloniellales bacterium]
MLILNEVLAKSEVREVREVLDRTPFESRKKARQSQGKAAGVIKNNLELMPGRQDLRPVVELIRARLLSHFEFGSYAMPRDMRFFFNRYESGMFYDRHVDMTLVPRSKTEMMRLDLSFTLFLSEPEEYEGGDFVIDLPYGEQRIRGAAGDVILYLADTLHRVEPVIRGARTSVVGWIESFIPDPTERQINFDFSLALKDIFETADTDLRRRLEQIHERLLRRWVQT